MPMDAVAISLLHFIIHHRHPTLKMLAVCPSAAAPLILPALIAHCLSMALASTSQRRNVTCTSRWCSLSSSRVAHLRLRAQGGPHPPTPVSPEESPINRMTRLVRRGPRRKPNLGSPLSLARARCGRAPRISPPRRSPVHPATLLPVYRPASRAPDTQFIFTRPRPACASPNQAHESTFAPRRCARSRTDRVSSPTCIFSLP